MTTILVVVIPAAAGYVVLARPIIGLTLEYGALHSSSASATATTLALFAVGLPGFSAYLLLMRAFQAMQDTRSMFVLYVIENAINIVLAVALHRSLGVQGLALAFGLAYTISAIIAWRRLAPLAGGLPTAHVIRDLTRIAVASLLMAAVSLAVSDIVGGASNVRLLLRVGASVIAGVTVYVLVARTLHIEDLTALIAVRRRRAG